MADSVDQMSGRQCRPDEWQTVCQTCLLSDVTLNPIADVMGAH